MRNRFALNINMLTRLFLAFMLVAVIPMALIIYSYDRAARAALIEVGRASLYNAAVQVARRLDSFVNSNLDTVAIEAQFPVLADYLALTPDQAAGSSTTQQARALLTALKDKPNRNFSSSTAYNYIDAYLLLDATGKVVLSTNNADIGQSYADQEVFQRAFASSAPYVSTVLFTERNTAFQYYSARVTAPGGGRTLGVLVSRYNAIVYQTELVAAANETAGAGSFVVLLDENQLILGHGVNPDLLFKVVAPLDQAAYDALRAAGRIQNYPLAEASLGLADFSQNLAGAAQIPGFTVQNIVTGDILHEAAFAPMKTQTWSVGLFQPQTVIVASVGKQLTRALQVVFLGLGLVLVAAFVMARSITAPIASLSNTAAKIAAGDPELLADVKRSDEIGALAQSFNAMTTQLRSLIAGLEQRVHERTQALERRSAYLRASTEVSYAIASILDPEELIRQVVEMIRERFDLYYVGMFLLDEAGEWAVLRAGTGEAGQRMLARRHRIAVGTGMVGWSIANAQARVALDVGEDAVRLATAELPETRSEAALPLRSRGQVLGALTVQSVEIGAFDEQIIAVLQVMADQVAIALDNARLFSESQESLRTMQRLIGETSRQGWEEFFRTSEEIAYRCSEQGVSEAPDVWYPEMVRAWQSGQIVLREETEKEAGLALAIPIKVRDSVIGVLDTRKPAEGGEWSPEEMALLNTIAEQLGLALENAQLFYDSQRRAERERLIGEMTARIRETLDVETILKTTVKEMQRTMRLPEIFVRLGTPATEDDAGLEPDGHHP